MIPVTIDPTGYMTYSMLPHATSLWLQWMSTINNFHSMLKSCNRAAVEDHSSTCEFPLLTTPNNNDLVEDGSTYLKGRPSRRSLTGGWVASLCIIGIEITEQIAYYGIVSNLVTYLTNVMHQTTSTAAKNVNVWAGIASMLPLLGAFVADSYLGPYWTILISSIVYLVGSSFVPNSFF